MMIDDDDNDFSHSSKETSLEGTTGLVDTIQAWVSEKRDVQPTLQASQALRSLVMITDRAILYF